MKKDIEAQEQKKVESRLQQRAKEIKELSSAASFSLYVADLASDKIAEYDFEKQGVNHDKIIEESLKGIVSENISHIDHTDAHLRLFTPLRSSEDRFFGSLILTWPPSFKLSPSLKKEIELKTKDLSVEYELKNLRPVTIKFPKILGENVTFNDFIQDIHLHVDEAVEYLTSFICQERSSGYEILSSNVSSPKVTDFKNKTIENGTKLSNSIQQSIESTRVKVLSDEIILRKGIPLKNDNNEVIKTIVVIPLNSKVFKGAILLGTSLYHYVTQTELRSMQFIGEQVNNIIETYSRVSKSLKQAKEDSKGLALHEVGELAQSARHKARTQLDLIGTSLRNLKARLRDLNVSDEGVNAKLATISRGIAQAFSCLDEMADQAQIQNMISEEVSLNQIISGAVAVESARAQINNIDIVLPIRDRVINCYPLFLEHALFHLIQNAIDCFERRKNSHQKKWIRIRTSGGPREITIAVEDNAGGFQLQECFFNSKRKVSDLDELFHVGSSFHHRKHNAEEGRGPNGQGLSTVKQYVSLHSGSVKASSGPHGALFVIKIKGAID